MEDLSSRNNIVSQWVHEFTTDLTQWALSRTNNGVISEDLVQDTFIAALKSFDKFENRSHPKTWLISILNHKISDFYKTESKINVINSQGMSEGEANQLIDSYFNTEEHWNKTSFSHEWDSSSEHLLDNPDFLKVWAICMDDLPFKWKEAITAKYILEKKSEEISQELNISMTNYWQYIHRAKVLLKKCIEVYWN